MTDAAGISRAIGEARDAFDATRRMPSWKRAQALRQIRGGIARRRAEFADAIVAEAGKPLRFAEAEVDRCLVTFSLAAEEAGRTGGEVLAVDLEPRAESLWCAVERFPKGVVAALTPFNFPLNLLAHKVAPAIACGCPVVAKPSPRTPRAALLLAEEAAKTAWPAAAFSVVVCENADAPALWRDPRVAVLSFTGSDAVGWKIKEEAPRKTVVLELGGNAAAIVHDDADLDAAARKLASSAFAYAGQVCIKAQRILVSRAVFEPFLERFMAAARELPAGDLRDPKTALCPLIDEDAARRVDAWIEEALAAGAVRVAGGAREGRYVPPTILTGVDSEAKVRRREVFGPVAIVDPYDDFDGAIAAANDTAYGLHAAVFTRDIGRIRAAYRSLEVGGVLVNEPPSTRIDNFPYGGVKASGAGREGVRSTILEYTEPRVLLVSSA
ncbi:MAG TPA: aldehyde dehydrogenase family protein [Thermoanaerobaculia bacterium]|nr:aldehyde dehydrogenase family protein [Thermoanaerobaculia bacterium]